MRKKYCPALEQSEKKTLQIIIKKGHHNARVITRARILLMADKNTQAKTDAQICEALGVSKTTPGEIRKKYYYGGINRVIYDKPHGRPARVLDLNGEAQVIAIACSNAPKGRNHWTLELISQKATKLLKKAVSRYVIWKTLKNNNLKPWREKNVVYTRGNRRI